MQPSTSFPDATKDEYRDDRLHKAAEIVWLWLCGNLTAESQKDEDGIPPEDWVPEAVRTLKAVLDGDAIEGSEIPFYVYWRALEIQNLPRIEASSSAVRERTERYR